LIKFCAHCHRLQPIARRCVVSVELAIECPSWGGSRRTDIGLNVSDFVPERLVQSGHNSAPFALRPSSAHRITGQRSTLVPLVGLFFCLCLGKMTARAHWTRQVGMTLKKPKASRRPSAPVVIGWRETVALPDLGIDAAVAKIDTGARTSALHATRIRHFERDGAQWVRFHVPHAGLAEAIDCEAPLVDSREIKNTSGVPEERLVIATRLTLGGRSWNIDVSLADRAAMSMPLILGRTAIRRHRILVNPGRSFLAAPVGKES